MITTHVLDTAKGHPAAGIPVILEMELMDGRWAELGRGETDADGRLRTLTPPDEALAEGTYRLIFETQRYLGQDAFYPEVEIRFTIRNAKQHYHVPLLLSPYGYTTYRGS